MNNSLELLQMIGCAVRLVPKGETVVGVELEDDGRIGYAPGLQRLEWKNGTVDVFVSTVGPRHGTEPPSAGWSTKRWRLLIDSAGARWTLQLTDETWVQPV